MTPAQNISEPADDATIASSLLLGRALVRRLADVLGRKVGTTPDERRRAAKRVAPLPRANITYYGTADR